MANNSPSFGAMRAPIVDQKGFPSYPFLKKLQEWETKLNAAITMYGGVLLSAAVGILAKANGGTGTATPGDTAGAGIQITGSWPNETIAGKVMVGDSGAGGAQGDVPAPGVGDAHKVLHGDASFDDVDLASEVLGILPVVNGGNGSATPGLTDSSNVGISGSWPNEAVDLKNTTVTPGSYTNMDATVDSKGRITAASNGVVDLASEVSGILPVVNGGLGVNTLPVYANNAAAVSGGLAVGDFYRDGGDPDHVCVVH